MNWNWSSTTHTNSDSTAQPALPFETQRWAKTPSRRARSSPTPLDLVDLPACMDNQRRDHARLRRLLELLETLLGSVNQATADISFNSVRLALRASRRADLVETLLHFSGEMSPLAPASDVVLPRRTAQLPEQAPHRVPQQVDIAGSARRSRPQTNHSARATAPSFFFATAWPLSTTNRPISDRSRGSTDTHCPAIRIVLRERTVAQELAHRSMLIHKLMDTVKVTTKTLFEDTHHQDTLHPRTSHVAIGARQNVPSNSGSFSRVSSCEYRCWRPRRTAGMSSRDL